MFRQLLGPAALALVAAVYPLSAGAAIIDDMDDTTYFSDAFGAASVVDNLDGTVSLTKNAAGVDSGITWNNAGLKIDLAESAVTITPAVDNEDFINVTAQYFDVTGAFVNAALVVADTNTDAPINFDVAASAGVGAESYVLQLRILPFNATSAAYTFDSIQAVPEPASLALLGTGLLCLMRRPRSA